MHGGQREAEMVKTLPLAFSPLIFKLLLSRDGTNLEFMETDVESGIYKLQFYDSEEG